MRFHRQPHIGTLLHMTSLFLNIRTRSHINFTGGLMENQPLMILLCVSRLTEGRNIQHYQSGKGNKSITIHQLYSTHWIIKNIKQARVSASQRDGDWQNRPPWRKTTWKEDYWRRCFSNQAGDTVHMLIIQHCIWEPRSRFLLYPRELYYTDKTWILRNCFLNSVENEAFAERIINRR